MSSTCQAALTRKTSEQRRHQSLHRSAADLGHLHLREAAPIDYTRVLHRLLKHTKRIMQTALCFIQYMRACTWECTRLSKPLQEVMLATAYVMRFLTSSNDREYTQAREWDAAPPAHFMPEMK